MMSVGRFNAEAYCVVHCLPNSDVVQMTSNIADRAVAIQIASEIRKQGGHVFRRTAAEWQRLARAFQTRNWP